MSSARQATMNWAVAAALLLVLGSATAPAEGFTFKDGHFEFEKVMPLRLTEKQARAVRRHFKPGMKIALSKAQRAQILAGSGVKEAPTKLEIYKVENLEGDCSCGMANFGILVGDDVIEIPVSRICSDREAAEGAFGG